MTANDTDTSTDLAEDDMTGEDQGREAPPDRQEQRDQRVRERLRSAQEQLAAARAQVEALTRREVRRLLSEPIEGPDDALRLEERNALDFLTEDGNVNEHELTEFADQVLNSRPHLRKVTNHHGDLGPRGVPLTRIASWDDVIRKR